MRMQECSTCQSQVLRLHNLCTHPALASCISDANALSKDAAVKPWAAALLKLRCSKQSSAAAGVPRSASESSVAEASVAFLGAAALQQHQFVGCMAALSAAAKDSLQLMQQVSFI